MKKIYLSIISLSLVIGASAQNRSVSFSRPMINTANASSERTPTDTLYWTNTNASPTLIGSANGGFVCGNNGYGDEAKVQGFLLTSMPAGGTPIAVEEVLIWFGAKSEASNDTINSTIKVNVYNMNGNGVATSGNVTSAPGNILATVTLPIHNVDTGGSAADGLNLFQFGFPVWCGGDFGVGVDFTSLVAGDTLGIVSSSDGDAGSNEQAWEKWSDNTWHSMLQAWPLDIDFAIWPIIDNLPQSTSDQIGLNGVSLGQNYPNPSTGVTNITYSLTESAKQVKLHLIDANGKKVMEINEGTKTAGTYNLSFDLSKLAAGNYYYTIQADGKRMGRKMSITK